MQSFAWDLDIVYHDVAWDLDIVYHDVVGEVWTTKVPSGNAHMLATLLLM